MINLASLSEPSEKTREFFSRKRTYAFTAALIGAVIFLLIYGIETLWPTNVSFLYNSEDADVFNHQLGFDFYRISPWRNPIGVQSIYPYPYESSVIFSDSIPLLAFFFKLLSPILPEYFQYFGLWIFLCFILQGVSASLLLKKLGIGYIKTMLFVPFFIINVPFLFRCFHHSSLAGQWVVLFAFLLILCESEMSPKKRTALWMLLCGGSILIHGYLFFMCGFLMSFSCFYQFVKNKKRISSLIVFFGCVAVSLSAYWLGGGFLPHDNVIMRGFPGLVFDPVDLINPLIFSSFLPRIEYLYSTESAVYWGIAFMLLLITAIVILIRNRGRIKPFIKEQRFFFTLTLLASLFLFVISEGLRPRIAGIRLFDLVGSDPNRELLAFLSTFRATARFFLPVWYLIQIGVFYIVGKGIRSTRIAVYLLMPLLILQYLELVPLTAKGRAEGIESGYSTVFNDCFDRVFNEDARHLSFISDTFEDISAAGVFASHHNMSMNTSKACRGPKNSVQADLDAWNNGTLSEDTVYLLIDDYLPYLSPKLLPESWLVYYCDGHICFFHKDLLRNAPGDPAVELSRETLYEMNEQYYNSELAATPIGTFDSY
ncbi:MAG: DUF6311 domain-containing protein [Lachnospiraceae bacterium]|nr:DUF6311 domain-containing protein [Lachnospiraceae bacterium]